MEKSLIQVTNVEKSFKDIRAVSNLSFSIQPGEYVAILGPNGAGKTTLVEMIEGIQKPDRGEITIDSMNWSQHKKKLSKILGVSLQETRFMEKVKCIEIMKLFASFYGVKSSRCYDLLSELGLAQKTNSYAHLLSGGQKQKLALAIALMHEPRIIILDEPTTGLDPNARREIWKILGDLKSKKTTLLLTTHYMEEAEKLCDRIFIMEKGKILLSGTLNELIEENAAGELIQVKTAKKPPSFKEISGVKKSLWDPHEKKLKLVVSSIHKVLPPLLRKIDELNLDILEIDSRKMTLDDLFVQITGKRLDG